MSVSVSMLVPVSDKLQLKEKARASAWRDGKERERNADRSRLETIQPVDVYMAGDGY